VKNQNDMMDFVWLLNTINTNAAVLQGLCAEFLKREKEFYEIRREVQKNAAQGQYIEKEVKLSMENLTDLNEKTAEIIDILQKAKG